MSSIPVVFYLAKARAQLLVETKGTMEELALHIKSVANPTVFASDPLGKILLSDNVRGVLHDPNGFLFSKAKWNIDGIINTETREQAVERKETFTAKSSGGISMKLEVKGNPDQFDALFDLDDVKIGLYAVSDEELQAKKDAEQAAADEKKRKEEAEKAAQKEKEEEEKRLAEAQKKAGPHKDITSYNKDKPNPVPAPAPSADITEPLKSAYKKETQDNLYENWSDDDLIKECEIRDVNTPKKPAKITPAYRTKLINILRDDDELVEEGDVLEGELKETPKK